MEVFLRNPGQTLPRQLLLTRVWGLDSDVEEGNLDNYIHFLRRRLKTVESSLQIKTVRGVGYQLEVFSSISPALLIYLVICPVFSHIHSLSIQSNAHQKRQLSLSGFLFLDSGCKITAAFYLCPLINKAV